MASEVKLSELDSALEPIDFPCSREVVVEEGEDVTLLLADGTANLGELVSESTVEQFESVDDLTTELMNHLPRRAVGEPYQSEGEG